MFGLVVSVSTWFALRREEKFFVINGKKYRRRKTVIYRLKIQRKGDKIRFRELVNFAIARKGRVLELLK